MTAWERAVEAGAFVQVSKGSRRVPRDREVGYIVQENGCWEWTGRRHKEGYGKVAVWRGGKRTTTTAHRFVYEQAVGPIPDGLQLDHLCKNPPCVNPAHLEPVTPRENLYRGETVTAKNAAKTHCKRGHPLTGANLRRATTRNPTARVCAECRRLRDRGWPGDTRKEVMG